MLSHSSSSRSVFITKLPRWKKLVFGVLTAVFFFLAFEVVLAVCGVRPVLATRDPFVGFSSNVPLFAEQTPSDKPVTLAIARNKLEYFNPQEFPREKLHGSYRIFCMGGSTTYGRPYDDMTSFAGWLRELLPAADSSRKWQVINAGGISYASYRVAALMEELVGYTPDLFIVYSGHNEFLEERTYRDIKQAPAARLWVSGVLSRTRTWTFLDGILNRTQTRQQDKRFMLASEVDAMLDHTVGPDQYQRDDKLRDQISDHYNLNLSRMVAIARSAGAKILFINPASNLKDCSPFKSEHRRGIDDEDLRQWEALSESAKSLQRSGMHAEALEAYQQAAALDDRYAELHFRMGRLLFELRRLAEARTAFGRATDEDVCPLRALTRMQSILAQTADRLDVPLIDFDAMLKNDCLCNHGHNSPGREYFLDHVHPTIAANRMLAVGIVNRLIQDGVVKQGRTWGDAAIAKVTERVEASIDPLAHAVALRNLAKVLSWAGKHYDAGPLALKALQSLPNDSECLVLSAAYLKMTGNAGKAIEYYRKALKLKPEYVEAHQMLGAALVETGDLPGALHQFSEVVRLHPDDAHAHHMIGAVLAEQQQYEQALRSYHKANRLKPNDPDVHFNIANALAKLGKDEQAVRWYRNTLQLNPDDADAHNNLGLLLIEEDRFDEAVRHFEQALLAKPDFEEAAKNLKIARSLQKNARTN